MIVSLLFHRTNTIQDPLQAGSIRTNLLVVKHLPFGFDQSLREPQRNSMENYHWMAMGVGTQS